jgi:hypothetical protein
VQEQEQEHERAQELELEQEQEQAQVHSACNNGSSLLTFLLFLGRQQLA